MKVWRSVHKQLGRGGGVDAEEDEEPSGPSRPTPKDADQARLMLRQRIEASRRSNGG